MKFNAKEMYKDYPIHVQKYMDLIIKYLEGVYGELDTVYKISLDMMAMNLDIMYNAVADLHKQGMIVTDPKERLVRNHSIQHFNNAQSYLIKLINQFGFTPVAKKKLNALSRLDNLDKEPIDEFI